MNQTSTKAVDGKTPYEAAFVKKPNLRDVCEWGEKVWVRIEGGDKLGGRVHEGRWMGIDEQSKGVQVYWPDKTTVGVERNVYYDKMVASVSHLKGEEGIIELKTDLPMKRPPHWFPQRTLSLHLPVFLALCQPLNLMFKLPNTFANPVNVS